MKQLILFTAALFITISHFFSQTTVTYNFTGGVQNFVVPPCVTSLSVTVAGADGGGALGGNGAIVTSTFAVTPGQTIGMIVGGSGGSPGGGYNGGGSGYASTDGNTSYNSSSGGGATNLTINGVNYIIAAGGGGAGGGSGIVAGGAGGCATGVTGSSTFGGGATGGTQVSGGIGGTPWAATPPGGQNGSLGQGGNGGLWQTASGGGGGGGYYGGGGGGNDGCCTGANGGGGGGGGSSLVPAGAGCTQGSNNGPGYVTITYTTATVVPTFTQLGPYCQCAAPGVLPTTSLNGISGTWSPATISTATAGTTTYTFTPNPGQCGTPTTMNITVNPVSVTMPANGAATVACPANTNTAPTPPTVIDNCGRTLTVSAPVISAIPACAGTRTYTYTYTNACGTTYPWTYTYTVSPPIVTMPANGAATVACPANTNTAPTTPTVLDNCGRTLTVSAPVISAIPTCTGTRTYTYTYTACNGATFPWTFTYTVSPPIVTMPANGAATVACPANTNTAPTPPTVLDNCGRTLTVSAPVISAIPTCAGTRTYSYTYTACNGTTFPWTFTYTVSPPIVTMPANGAATVACPANTNTAPTPPTVLDNCGRTLTVSAPVISAIPTCAGTRTYTYTYTACNGTTFPWTFTYTVSPPVVTMPANGATTVACPTNTDTAPTPPTVLDNCGRTLTVSAPVISAIPTCAGTRTYTYTYTACNGTTFPWTFTYTVSPPIVTMPANGIATVACPTNTDTAPTPPTVLDNCGRTLTVSAPVISAIPACAGTRTYTYTYTACNGTTFPWTYTYTVSPPAPVTMPANGASTVACASAATAPTAPTVTDNCGRTLTVSAPVISPDPACAGTKTYTYTYSDCAGVTYTWVYTYTISAPVVVMPANGSSTVACPTAATAPTAPTVTDNCGRTLTVSAPVVSPDPACAGTKTYTYTYSDCAGVTYTWMYTYTISAPVVVMPANGSSTVACPTAATAPTAPTVTDNCGRTLTVSAPVVSPDPACTGTKTYTYTYSDCAGVTYSWVYTYTISAPVVVMPANGSSTVVCPTAATAPTAPTVTDNCGRTLTVSAPVISPDPACAGTKTYTYTYTDCAGVTYSWVYTYTISAPVVVMPANGVSTVSCTDQFIVPTAPAVVDNCGRNLTVSAPVISPDPPCGGTKTYTYTFTDCSGTNYTWVYTYTYIDNIPPTASNPADISVPGGPAPAPDPLVVTDEADNCGTPTVAWVNDLSDGGSCPETIIRTYSVTDACGNQILVTQTVTIGDPINPTASNPDPITVECIGDVPAPNPAVVIDAADNSGAPIVTWESDVSDNNTCPETITRTYRVTDPCANFIFVTQTITIQDITAPVFAAPPAAITVACAADVPAMINLGYTDNCDPAGSVTGTDVSDGNTCPETITRTWTYSDACGNPATTSQIITVHDLVAPVFAAPPAAITVACTADVPAMINLGYTDNCDPAGTVTGTDVSDGNTCPETITRTWTYTDACGNVATTSQTITVHDLVAPVFAAAPAAITVECLADVPAMTNLGYTDNCDPAGSVTGTDGALIGGACGGTITRTWSVTDACGNTSTTTQTITVDDTTPPTASNPATTTVPGGPAPAVDPAVVIDEADNCTATPVVAFVSESTDGAACPETITRIYSVTDDCGNTINVTHTILITDPIDPTASNPLPITVECIGDVPAPDPTVVTDEADNNGIPVVTWESDVSDNNTCPETITRTYRVTDVCSNFIFVTQTITVNDITAPVGIAPDPITVECITEVPAANTALVTGVSDNCTAAPLVAFVSDVSNGATCPEVITRTYSITDDCGNSTNVTQLITIDDTTPPVGTAPAAITVECIGDVPAANIATVTGVSDNCTAAPVVAFVDDVSDGATCPQVITRTYSITDNCGNVTTVTQTITVDDTTPPTASNPATTTVPGGPAPAVDPAVVIDEADNCTAAPIVAFVSESSDGQPCPETITRIYSVTDDCGNTINVTHTILITDPIDPTASNPLPITVECIGDVPAPDPTVVTDEADNNGIPVVTWESDVSDNNTCPETITRTYRVTDVCSNFIFVTQTITVNDITAPVGVAPDPITVECITEVPAANTALVTGVSDNCTAAPLVEFVSDVSNGATCPEVITRTYSITDDCGNSTNVTQLITIDDTTPPVGTAPAAITVECIGDVPAANIATVTGVSDNCTAAPVVAFVDDVSDGATCPQVITRTYSITDNCGNVTTVTQTITVDDTTPPTASNPATTTVPGGPAPAVDPAVVIDEADNCTAAPIVAFVSESSDGQPCPETITRIYSVTDDCGNTINVTHTILITDPIDPTASNPLPITVECIGDVPAPDPTVVTDEADNNGIPVVTWESDVSDNNTCPETITRTYRVTDVCSNFIFVTQTITVNDITAPVGVAPDPITVECITEVPAANTALVTGVSDNCTAAPLVEFVSDVSNGATCPEVITRTYSITDDCGNSTNVTQLITIDDTTPPVGTAPAAITVECIGDVPAANIATVTGVSDNCTAAPVVAFVNDVSDGATCPQVITRTYSITDDCGNVTTVTQTITVDDTTPPTASNPATTTVPGGPAPAVDPAVVIDEADNCTAAPIVAFVSESSDGQPCPETITRIYSVTDDCGNTINVTHTILITDPIDPTASNPLPITVECIGDVPAPDPTVVTDEADNNGVPVVTWESDVSDNNTCPETITRTYRVTDVCDNFIFVTQTITVNDITAPVGVAPGPITVECITEVPAANTALVTGVSDNCTAAPLVEFVSDVSNGATCPEVITRTYSITDDCGNSTNVTQLITIDDTTPPVGTAPAAITVECIGDVPAANIATVTGVSDNCTAAPVVAFVNDVSDGATCPQVITRTYSITDDCGNVTTVTQTITVDDTTPPTASNPLGITVELISQVPAPNVAVVTDEADNCTAVPVVAWINDVSNGGTCPEIITRTYSVTDDCGNSITVQQLITVSDITLPTASNPTTVNVECIGDVPAPNIAVVTDPADNSGSTTVAWLNDVSDGNSCPETITRTYSVSDDCNNTITVQQTIIVNDVTPPTATAPAAVTVECIEDVPPVPLSAATLITDATDNCTAIPTIDWVSDVSNGNTCPEVITRTYRVMDDCGNQTLLTQQITILDVTAPTASNPAPINVECIFDVPLPNPAVVIDEDDNCSIIPIVTWVNDVSNGNSCPEVITRTYAVTDACGNQTLVTQTITINDVTNPTASNPAPISVVSAATVPAPDPSVVLDEADNCAANPVVAWVSDVSDGNVCNNEQITRTYSVTDDCGNSITVTQIITITAIYPTVDAGPNQTLCEAQSATVNATFTPPTTVISWNNGILNNVPFTPSVGTTTYTVTANNYECISTDQLTILVHPLPVVGLVPDENMGCQPLEVEFTNLSSSAAGLISCTWNLGDGTVINGCNGFSHTYEGAGFFDVTLTTTDGNGCTNSATFDNLIYVEPYPIADFTASNYNLNNLLTNTEVDFTNNSVGASTYFWSFGDDAYSTQVNPSHIYDTEFAENFSVMLVAYSALGCPDTTYQNFTVTEELIYYVPNTFTPDGNAFNNTFQPVFTSGFDPFDFNLYIFNRWGEIIFESHDATVGWDGTYNGELMQDGTYTWKIDFKSRVNDKKYQAVGHVNLLR
jgi:gliding motility-associated-like protein